MCHTKHISYIVSLVHIIVWALIFEFWPTKRLNIYVFGKPTVIRPQALKNPEIIRINLILLETRIIGVQRRH